MTCAHWIQTLQIIDVLLIFAGIASCSWLFVSPQAPGVAVTVFGFFAAAIAFRNVDNAQKVIWVAIMLSLMLFELRDIHIDHVATLKENQAAIDLETSSLNNLTGGDSFPYVVPQSHSPIRSSGPSGVTYGLPLAIWNAGNYPLLGVSLEIVDANNFPADAVEAAYGRPDITFAVLPPHGYANLKDILNPVLGKDGTSTYIMYIYRPKMDL